MAKWITNSQIGKMSYNQLGRALTTGELTEKRLRSYYSEQRNKANKRIKRVSSEKVMEQYGNVPEQYFQKTKNLITTSQLLHAIADVGAWLRSESSTVTGLKKKQARFISNMRKAGLDVDADNVNEWRKFFQWFEGSEYAKIYDSESEEVAEAFHTAEKLTKDDIDKAFKAIEERKRKNAENNKSNRERR